MAIGDRMGQGLIKEIFANNSHFVFCRQVFTAPFARRPQHQLTGYSSDGDTEED